MPMYHYFDDYHKAFTSVKYVDGTIENGNTQTPHVYYLSSI